MQMVETNKNGQLLAFGFGLVFRDNDIEQPTPSEIPDSKRRFLCIIYHRRRPKMRYEATHYYSEWNADGFFECEGTKQLCARDFYICWAELPAIKEMPYNENEQLIVKNKTHGN